VDEAESLGLEVDSLVVMLLVLFRVVKTLRMV